MVSEWRETTVGKFSPFSYGKGLPEHGRNASGNVPVFGSNGFVGFHDSPLTEGPTVIIGRKGTVGAVHYSPLPCWPIDTTFWISEPDHTTLRFKYYLLKSLGLDRMNSDSAVPGLNREAAHARRIVVPPIPEQRAIAHILGTLDDKIELNRQMNETLEAMAQALFKSWFVDFAPVRAKAEGRNTGLPKHLADLFPDRFEDSESSEIPAEWRVGRVADVAGFLCGYAFRSKDWLDDGVPVIKIGAVKPGIVDLNKVSYVSSHVAAEAKGFRLNSGDLLIGMTGYVGEVGLVPPTDNPPLLNQRVGKFVLETTGTMAVAFIYCLTRRSEFKAEVETKSHGTAQANVSADDILSIFIVIPPRVLQDEFNKIGQPIFGRILANHAESHTLAALRDTLLPNLISGELVVKDAERFIERVV